MAMIVPGDRLVIRGYSGKILETNVVYKRSYWTSGELFIVYERDGVQCSVDARRAELVEESAIGKFQERLAAALDILDEIGANYCGDLTEKQAKRFHKAVAKLSTLMKEQEF